MSEINLKELDIIGYANVLDARSVPHVVAPIFRFRAEHDRLVFPPYRIAGPVVLKATMGSGSDLRSAIASGKATALAKPISARDDHELWINQRMNPQYEPALQAEETLRGIAKKAISEARAALREGRLDEADRFAGTAMAADDRLAEPVVIKAAVYRLRNDEDGLHAMRILAKRDSTPDGFDMAVETLMMTARNQQAQKQACSRMWRIAGEQPTACRLPEAAAA